MIGCEDDGLDLRKDSRLALCGLRPKELLRDCGVKDKDDDEWRPRFAAGFW
jgi:hypothetical protein